MKRNQMGYQGKFEIEEYWSQNQKSIDRMQNQISPFSPGSDTHLNVNLQQVANVNSGEQTFGKTDRTPLIKKDTDLIYSEPPSTSKGQREISNPASYLNTYDEDRNKKRPILITDNEKGSANKNTRKVNPVQEHLNQLTEESIRESNFRNTHTADQKKINLLQLDKVSALPSSNRINMTVPIRERSAFGKSQVSGRSNSPRDSSQATERVNVVYEKQNQSFSAIYEAQKIKPV